MVSIIQQVNQWDARMLGKIFGEADHKSWTRFFYTLSRSAESYSCALMAFLWVMLKPDTVPYVAAGILAFALELTLYYILKKNIKRPRPFKKIHGIHCLIIPPDEFSFPSGHTAAAFLMATLVSMAFPILIAPHCFGPHWWVFPGFIWGFTTPRIPWRECCWGFSALK
jgi:undecaprenyl-diphosphatase